MELDDDKRKPHRPRVSGRKAEKKKKKTAVDEETTDRQRNPKAFAINHAVAAQRKFRRTQDLKRKKEHIPVVDRTPLEPPPVLVAVVGPPKVGKSLLIKCLIKSYTSQPLTAIKGPVTVVSGKRRRITFIECGNDINSMVDIAKVADLILLLVDASFGFEMEIFEFLNICQVHGMPKIMGVLTHLDMVKHTKKLQKTKKTLKHRFWKEVYPGAKLFYLSDLKHGQYLKNEIKNLARFMSVMKFRPLTWQTTHPYMLADRMEDMTPPENIQLDPKVDRTVCLYGYMRGIPMNKNSFVHIPGCGDFAVHDISFLPDPCPLPEQLKKRNLVESERIIYAPFSGVGGIVYDKDAVYVELPGFENKSEETPGTDLVNTLLETKETIDTKLASSKVQLFSGGQSLTGSQFEELKQNDEVSREGGYSYIKVVGEDGRERKKVVFEDDDENDMSQDEDDDNMSGKDDDEVMSQDDQSEVEDAPKPANNPDYSSAKPSFTTKEKEIKSKISDALAALEFKDIRPEEDHWSECSSSTDEGDEDSSVPNAPWNENLSEENDSGLDDDEDEDESDIENTDLKWKTNLAGKAAQAFIERQSNKHNLFKLVYGEAEEMQEKEGETEIGGLFKIVNKDQENTVKNKDILNSFDCSKFPKSLTRDWNDPEVIETIKDCFVTGKWKESEDADELLKLDDLSDDEEEVFGDFEDLETGEKFKAKTKEVVPTEEKPKAVEEKPKLSEPPKNALKAKLLEKKLKLKARFDAMYDNNDEDETYFEQLKSEMGRQAELNKKEFETVPDEIRVGIEGFRAGLYVRIEIQSMPCEMVEFFDPTYPVVVGGLQPGEQNVGYVKVRVKKHRWYNKILKTRDPLIVSMGWRRFQTIAVYSKLEDNMRHRMLKYTPEHLACMAHFWGPMTPAGTGFLAVLSASAAKVQPGFRIVATGTVLDSNQTTQVTKKLKLNGTPIKVFRKTAFIEGMFTSSLEVARFEGAKIRTVSGVRGQIKKPLTKPEGAFRATFEDKILLSDIVFCRTWYRVDIPKLYVPVTSLLLSPEQKGSWEGMRTLGMLKKERGIRNEAQLDSMYTEITRGQKRYKPLVVPAKLAKELPYRVKRKVQVRKTKERAPFSKKISNVVVRDDHDAQASSFMSKLKINHIMKSQKMKEEKKRKVKELIKKKQAEQAKREVKHKETKKSVYRALSKLDARKNKDKMKKSKKPR